MKIDKENYWFEVESALGENTPSGFKIACIEAEKVFRNLLRKKGYPDDIDQTIALFGWKLTDKDALKKAVLFNEKIKNTFDYRLSNFEAEDIVEVFKQAIDDFTKAKDLTWQRKAILLWENYFSFKSSFLKKLIVFLLVFFLSVKMLAHTKIGLEIVSLVVKMSDFLYSWFLFFVLIAIGVFVFLILSFMYFEKGKTRIKSIKEK